MTLAVTSPSDGKSTESIAGRIDRLRTLAWRGLARLYLPDQRLFAHHARRVDGGIAIEGRSVRYTAMVLIGLAGESDTTVREVLHGHRIKDVCDRLIALNDAGELTNLGDVAVVHWALRASGYPRPEGALANLRQLLAGGRQHETVELSWVLAALCEQAESSDATALRDMAARRLLMVYNQRSALFAHETGLSPTGLRGHVACFADLVYPIHALARYHMVTSDPRALCTANECANRMCALLGPAGQWWWHCDLRTGRTIERYPVYAVHQDAMAPMALLTLSEAGGDDHFDAIAEGLAWLESAPELGGGSLIDESEGLIWRKVARREPRKLVRRLQGGVSRLHSTLRWPGVDALFPARVIDDECRPYHLGWLLYAWPAKRTRQAAIEGATANETSQ